MATPTQSTSWQRPGGAWGSGTVTGFDALLPLAVIALVMVASPTTNWLLVEQNTSSVLTYAAGPTLVQRFAATFGSLIAPGGYILVALAGLIWLARHSDKPSNVARVVLIIGGLTAMLFGGGLWTTDGTPGGTREVNYTGKLEDALSCISHVGDAGCGFESPLEAIKRALDGRHPENAGFLRPGAFLAVVILTDEDLEKVPDIVHCTERGVPCSTWMSVASSRPLLFTSPELNVALP